MNLFQKMQFPRKCIKFDQNNAPTTKIATALVWAVGHVTKMSREKTVKKSVQHPIVERQEAIPELASKIMLKI